MIRYIEKDDAKKSLLLAAKCGLYSKDDTYDFLKANFGAEAIVYDAQFKANLKPRTFHKPLSLTAYKCLQRRQHVHSHAYFLLDPENPFDVVDYWNLPAAGMILLSLTLQDYKEFEQPFRDFGALAAYPINEKVTNHVVLIKARSISEDHLQTVADWIRSLGFLKDFSTMGWVPRARQRFMPPPRNNSPANRHGPYHYWTRKVKGRTIAVLLSEPEAGIYQEWIQNNRRLDRLVREMRQFSARALTIQTGRTRP